MALECVEDNNRTDELRSYLYECRRNVSTVTCMADMPVELRDWIKETWPRQRGVGAGVVEG